MFGAPCVVVFNFPEWQIRFPNFSETVDSTTAGLLFEEACIYLDNSPCSLIRNLTKRTLILNLLVAHLAQLNFGQNGAPATPFVGRVDHAGEGTVSVSTSMGSIEGGPSASSAAWYQQTQFGSQAWQMMSTPRLGGRFFPGPQRNFGINVPYFNWNRYAGPNT